MPDQKKITKLIPLNILEKKYPLTWKYLFDNKKYLENRENGKLKEDNWHGYIYPKALDVISLPKIFTPDIAKIASFSWDQTGEIFFTGGVAGGYGIVVSQGYAWEYILGLLNSKLLEFYIKKTSTAMRGEYYCFESRFIRNLPIYIINTSLKDECKKHDLIVNLVKQTLSLYQEFRKEQTPPSRKMLQNQINATENQINQLVYQLYGITDPQEIAIIEGHEI
jgi:hypothetical protein